MCPLQFLLLLLLPPSLPPSLPRALPGSRSARPGGLDLCHVARRGGARLWGIPCVRKGREREKGKEGWREEGGEGGREGGREGGNAPVGKPLRLLYDVTLGDSLVVTPPSHFPSLLLFCSYSFLFCLLFRFPPILPPLFAAGFGGRPSHEIYASTSAVISSL